MPHIIVDFDQSITACQKVEKAWSIETIRKNNEKF